MSPRLMRIQKSKRINYILFISAFVAIVILLVIRCFYGLGIEFNDEYVQPASVKRFFYGDRLLIEDWQVSSTLLAFFMYKLVHLFPGVKLTLIHMRLLYVAFQSIIALLFFFLTDRRMREVVDGNGSGGYLLSCIPGVCTLAYLCSNPFGIQSICYNTVAIGMFLLTVTLFFDRFSKAKVFISGITLSIAVLSNPFIAILFFIYVLIVIIDVIVHKRNDEVKRLIWLVFGIAVLFIPFCVIFLSSGTLTEYINNLQIILQDPAHNEYGLLYKLFKCHYQLIRVYWREWAPLVIVLIMAFVTKKHEKIRIYLYGATCLITVYVTFRFAFIYGSVSINLMIIPMFFWGLSSLGLLLIWGQSLMDYKAEILWLLAGYLLAVCNYLATNTEILSTSAMFIISAMASIGINFRLSAMMHEKNRIYACSCGIVFLVFLMSLLCLRMTYVWGDFEFGSYDTKIEEGIATGIWASRENADKYYKKLRIINEADFSEDEKILILPTNPLCYLSVDGEIASPYISQLSLVMWVYESYYELHPDKLPTKVLLFLGEEEIEDEVCEYFTSRKYIISKKTDDYLLLE